MRFNLVNLLAWPNQSNNLLVKATNISFSYYYYLDPHNLYKSRDLYLALNQKE